MLLFCVIAICLSIHTAQTEGDTGYDYNDAYDDDFDDDSMLGLEPTFDVPIVNVTVVQGQTAMLPCSIDYLGKYKVSWVDHHFIPLSYEDRRVVDDHRFSIIRPYIKEWNLQIRDVTWEDQGQYRCTVNTDPVKSKIVMLHVKVPPQIIDELSSDDITVQEGDTVVLNCNVTGVPRPEVSWFRRVANTKSAERESKMCKPRSLGPGINMKGESIIITNVSRYCDDIYECVADNGVPTAVSRKMRVTVEFPPEIRMPNTRIGQTRGRDTILECIITAFPHAMNYWEKDGKQILSSTKHRIEAYDEGDHTITLSLRIHSIEADDYGEYKCVAANALGRDEESMWLYEAMAYPKANKDTRFESNYGPETSTRGPDSYPILIPGHATTRSSITYIGRTPKYDREHENSIYTENKHNSPASNRVTGGGSDGLVHASSARWTALVAVLLTTIVLRLV